MTDAALTTAIANLASNTKNTIDEFRAILTELFNRSYKTGDVLMLSCSNQYIIDNFDGTGLGIAERVGWAICNNANGTRDYNGKVPVAYGTDYPTMGASGGSKDAVVVEHSHSSGAYNTGTGTAIFTNKGLVSGSDTLYSRTYTEGVSGTDKNMQPYMVTLFIQKINA